MRGETRLALFECDTGRIAPMDDLRCRWDVRTGALTLSERLRLMGRAPSLTMPAAGRETLAPLGEPAAAADARPGGAARGTGDWLVIDARLARVPESAWRLGVNQAVSIGGEPTVWRLAAAAQASDVRESVRHARAFEVADADPEDAVLINDLGGWRRARDGLIAFDLDLLRRSIEGALLPPGVVELLGGGGGATVHRDARVLPTAVLDCERGHIVVDAGAEVRPGAIISGPVYIGPGCVVKEHAHVRPNTALGPVCRVGGEIGGTVMQSFSNKSHEGHLGDSWLGAWVNLGAATVNSNLLNTYGEVTLIAEPGGKRVRTGQSFFGCVLGDHVKTAIGTRIMTGAVAHTGVMYASSAAMSGCLGRFAWVTDSGEKRYRRDRFFEVARTVMSRRGIEMGPRYEARLGALFAQGGGE